VSVVVVPVQNCLSLGGKKKSGGSVILRWSWLVDDAFPRTSNRGMYGSSNNLYTHLACLFFSQYQKPRPLQKHQTVILSEKI
jgi:hypothetical protein